MLKDRPANELVQLACESWLVKCVAAFGRRTLGNASGGRNKKENKKTRRKNKNTKTEERRRGRPWPWPQLGAKPGEAAVMAQPALSWRVRGGATPGRRPKRTPSRFLMGGGTRPKTQQVFNGELSYKNRTRHEIGPTKQKTKGKIPVTRSPFLRLSGATPNRTPR